MAAAESAHPRVSFPSLRLVVPPLVPITLLAALPVGEWLGHHWNAHGDGLVLGALFQGSAVVAFIYELWLLPKVFGILRSPTANAAVSNWVCFLFSGAFSVVCVVWLLYVLLRAR